MKTLFTGVLLLLATTLIYFKPVVAQETCGTEISPSQLEFLNETRTERQAHTISEGRNNFTWIPIQVHIVRTSNGWYGMSTYTLGFLMADLNAYYANANVQFYHCGAPNFIDDDTYYNFNQNQEAAISVNDVPNVINVYFFGSLTSSTGGGLCGYAYFPGGPDRIMMSNNCTFNSSTFIHEFGHAFTLYHTHGKTNLGTTDELVNGSNCATAGDDVCDTPADPNLWQQVNSSCVYTGNQTDINGMAYTPLTNNIMSYSTSSCRDSLTPGQYARFNYSALNDRPYLFCPNPHPCVNPIASFPYTESFENGWGGWTQEQLEDFDFSLNSGHTPTQNTGPSAARQGSTYAYAEATGHSPGYTAVINSPCFDISSMNNPKFTFWYHMWGADVGQLVAQVSTDAGNTWVGNPIFVFQQTGDQANYWHHASIDLNPYKSSNYMQVRIGVVTGATDLGDIAIDDIVLIDSSGCPTITVNMQVTQPTCAGNDGSILAGPVGGNGPYSWLWNTGATTSIISGLGAGNYGVIVTDNNGCQATGVATLSASDPLELSVVSIATSGTGGTDGVGDATVSGGTPPYNFNWSNGAQTEDIQNVGSGVYTLTVSDAGGCSAESRIFVSDTRNCNGSSSAFPYNYSLETKLGWLRQNKDDDRNWKKRTGSTPTSGTGPSGAHVGSYYRYVESTGNNNSPYKTSVLTIKKCLNMTNLNNPEFRFWYHMYGSDVGVMEVQVSSDGGTTWTESIWIRSGDQGNAWQQAVIDLTPYKSSSTRMRIVATTATSGNGDMAIDDYAIGEAGNLDVMPGGSLTVTPVESTEEVSPQIRLAPNPAQNIATISLIDIDQDAMVVITDLQGKVVGEYDVEGVNRFELDLAPFKNGMYFITVESDGKMASERLIILK